jgi:glutamyl-tRNA synthetase
MTGRFAPSPSADLHIGNLRTAMLAWLFAKSSGRRFLIRVEDLDDRASDGVASRQLSDLAAIGVVSDDPPEFQTAHVRRYDRVIAQLSHRGLVYECYCSRKDILAAPRAPHAPEGAYPGTCRDRDRPADATRPPALRLRSDTSQYSVSDALHGEFTGVVDDFVLRRGDGVTAYNLAVVVDDAAQGVDQVVRGADLLASSPRQAYLAALLGYAPVSYAHVPLVLNTEGKRLAKRDGAVTLADLGVEQALTLIAQSLGYRNTTPAGMAAEFDPTNLPRTPWVYRPA